MARQAPEPTRRERQHQATRAEIMETARRQMRKVAWPALTPRSRARCTSPPPPSIAISKVATKSSPRWRQRAYESFADTLAAGRDSVPTDDHTNAFSLSAWRIVKWASRIRKIICSSLAPPSRFRSVDGNRGARGAARDWRIDGGHRRCVAGRRYSLPRRRTPPARGVGPSTRCWKREAGIHLRRRSCSCAHRVESRAWACSLELVGQLPGFMGSADELYRTGTVGNGSTIWNEHRQENQIGD